MSHPDHETNRQAWNDMVDVHWQHPKYKVKEFLDGWNSLKEIERNELGDVDGKTLLHLMCQFGMDTLSWARLGALVTGADISDRSIERAHQLAEAAGLKAEFVRSDVLDLVGVIDRQFDIVYQSYGTLCWLADLEKWAKVVAHYLKPGGTFLIIDDHPIICIYEDLPCAYLHQDAIRYSNEPDYCDRDFIVKKERVEHQHPLSEIVNCLISAGLVIVNLHEYDKGYYPIREDWVRQGDFWYPPDGSPLYPLMFSLKAFKPGPRRHL
ncbi:MAG: class I SAM-dependent methyltransferase [bacterium]